MGDVTRRVWVGGVLWGELECGAGKVALLAQEHGVGVGVPHDRRQVCPGVDHSNLNVLSTDD
jgi:hypothetical protein